MSFLTTGGGSSVPALEYAELGAAFSSNSAAYTDVGLSITFTATHTQTWLYCDLSGNMAGAIFVAFVAITDDANVVQSYAFNSNPTGAANCRVNMVMARQVATVVGNSYTYKIRAHSNGAANFAIDPAVDGQGARLYAIGSEP